jgi:16S rRNA (adenine1518-N6/adenine1519-N6)-dimethyltransferase
MNTRPQPRLKKRLGQHHLARPELCLPLIDFLRPEGSTVIEVGPGGGILTRPLLGRGARVRAIEMDLEWACSLRQSVPDRNLKIVVADAMTVSWEGLPRGSLVTGNLPYQISTALIERLLPLGERIPRACFLVQREVAQRLVARPRESAYGSLSVLVAAFSQAMILGAVGKDSFRPPPKVDGAFVGFRLLAPPVPENQLRAFTGVVRLAFGRRRKTLRNALSAGLGKERATSVVASLGKGDLVRAEELELDDFLRLFEIQANL